MSDPASLNVSVSVSGMSLQEAVALMTAMPAGACWEGVARPPQIGPMRYDATIKCLSIAGATAVTSGLLKHMERVADGGPDVWDARDSAERSDQSKSSGGSAEERSDDPSKASDLGEVS